MNLWSMAVFFPASGPGQRSKEQNFRRNTIYPSKNKEGGCVRASGQKKLR